MWRVYSSIPVRLKPYTLYQVSNKYYKIVRETIKSEIENILREKKTNLSNRMIWFLTNKIFVNVKKRLQKTLMDKVRTSSSDTAEFYLTKWGEILLSQSRNAGYELLSENIMDIKSSTKDLVENHLLTFHK